MNEDQIAGTGREVVGKIKETAGDVLNDPQLQGNGVADQIQGKTQQALGKAKEFAKSRPYAVATLAGVLGIALLNTLRGKK